MYIDNLFFKLFKTPVGGKVFDSHRLQAHSLLTITNSCAYVDIKESLFIWLKAYFGRRSAYVLNSAVNPNVQRYYKISYQFNQLAKGHI